MTKTVSTGNTTYTIVSFCDSNVMQLLYEIMVMYV